MVIHKEKQHSLIMAVVTIKINYLVEFISKTITATALSHIINELRFKEKETTNTERSKIQKFAKDEKLHDCSFN